MTLFPVVKVMISSSPEPEMIPFLVSREMTGCLEIMPFSPIILLPFIPWSMNCLQMETEMMFFPVVRVRIWLTAALEWIC